MAPDRRRWVELVRVAPGWGQAVSLYQRAALCGLRGPRFRIVVECSRAGVLVCSDCGAKLDLFPGGRVAFQCERPSCHGELKWEPSHVGRVRWHVCSSGRGNWSDSQRLSDWALSFSVFCLREAQAVGVAHGDSIAAWAYLGREDSGEVARIYRATYESSMTSRLVKTLRRAVWPTAWRVANRELLAEIP